MVYVIIVYVVGWILFGPAFALHCVKWLLERKTLDAFDYFAAWFVSVVFGMTWPVWVLMLLLAAAVGKIITWEINYEGYFIRPRRGVNK